MASTDLKINLEELEHQREALDAIHDAFPNLDKVSQVDNNGLVANSMYANPLIMNAFTENKFIDVKMETGTGKTYTYTRMMYELHRDYGMFKFIVIVPSSAIKEGAKSFLTADYARQHFKKFFPNTEMNVGLINSGDFSAKKGRKEIPNIIREFAEADTNDRNQIQVLLLNYRGFLDKATSSLFKDDYDTNLFGGESSPANMISKTRPIVIIDEPHRMQRKDNAYSNTLEKLKPEMIVRFGATFPDRTVGTGRNKVIETDYYRGDEPSFNLTAVDSFNRELVKGVAVIIPENASSADSYKVKSATKDKLVLERGGKEYEVAVGEALANVDPRFQGGLTYDSKGLLSNELEVETGMKLVADTFTNSYQEVLIRQALDAHFDSERANFLREGYPVKTNALFFIDNIDSYRDRGTGQATWLKDTFERLLKAKLEELIADESDNDYKAFLQESLNHITDTHGGYFVTDSTAKSTDDKVAEEVDTILRNKNKSLRLQDENGNWNILRFFFSQWTLREGWDNPNVFTIAKLRSSGSESSKIQEVGRGLRLPVDVMGNRLSSQEWWLNFVIDESESDFADRLLGEINEEATIPVVGNEEISDTIINKLVEANYAPNKREVRAKLYDANIIDVDDIIVDALALKKLLPKGKKTNKVRKGKPAIKKIKLAKENWNQIKEFWKEISKRYMITFEEIPDSLDDLFLTAIQPDAIFDDNKKLSVSVQKTNKGDEISIVTEYKEVSNVGNIGTLPYNKFVSGISNQTNLPMVLIHKVLVKRFETISNVNSIINDKTMAKIVDSWQATFVEKYASAYHYDALNLSAKTSILKQDEFVDDIAQNDVGTIPVETTIDARNLFKEIFVDSEHPEGDIAKIVPDNEIKVFGKIPRRAIQVPTYVGGTTTPDFVYATKNDMYLLVEGKSTSTRGTEDIAVNAQRNMFEKLKNVSWAKVTTKDEVVDLLRRFDNSNGII